MRRSERIQQDREKLIALLKKGLYSTDYKQIAPSPQALRLRIHRLRLANYIILSEELPKQKGQRRSHVKYKLLHAPKNQEKCRSHHQGFREAHPQPRESQDHSSQYRSRRA